MRGRIRRKTPGSSEGPLLQRAWRHRPPREPNGAHFRTYIQMRAGRIVFRGGCAVVVVLLGALLVGYAASTNDCDRLAAGGGNVMKAVVYCEFGSPEVLRLETIAKPVCGDDQVLIKVRAVSINPFELHFMRGTPYVGRLMGMGLRKPKSTRLGADVAGRVEAVGRNVTQFKPGEDVLGSAQGALAEYACASEQKLVLKPDNVTFPQAASVPIAAVTALQALRDAGKIQPGQRVLINGASGGVGTFAVQIAKALGAHVTGVCSTRNVAMVRALGADEVVDYTKTDFTAGAQRYDVIVDMVGSQSLSALRRILHPKGIYVMVGGPSGRWFAPLDRAVAAMVSSWFVSQKMSMMMAHMKKDDLGVLGDLMQAGKVKPVIDRTYSLSQVSEALRYLEAGHARGKVVVTLGE